MNYFISRVRGITEGFTVIPTILFSKERGIINKRDNYIKNTVNVTFQHNCFAYVRFRRTLGNKTSITLRISTKRKFLQLLKVFLDHMDELEKLYYLDEYKNLQIQDASVLEKYTVQKKIGELIIRAMPAIIQTSDTTKMSPGIRFYLGYKSNTADITMEELSELYEVLLDMDIEEEGYHLLIASMSMKDLVYSQRMSNEEMKRLLEKNPIEHPEWIPEEHGSKDVDNRKDETKDEQD